MLSKLIGAAKADSGLGARRYVRIDNNTVSFRLDENFSRAFPADDVAQRIDTGNIVADDEAAGHVARRWWDIEEPGWFGKGIGTVMLNVQVRKVPANDSRTFYPQPHDLHNRFHLLIALYERLHKEYTPKWPEDEAFGFLLPSLFIQIGDDLICQFYDRVFSGQVWTGFGIGQGEKTLTECFVIPVNERSYLQLSFTQAPNANIQGGYFSTFSEPLIGRIMQTLRVDYAADNSMQHTVEKTWHNVSSNAVLEQNRGLLMPTEIGDLRSTNAAQGGVARMSRPSD